MPLKTLFQACTPRQSVFDPSIRDTVYNIDDLPQIDAHRFFAENYVTQGMRQLLTEAFKRLEGKSQNVSGAFLLSQSMGGGKTHNLIALGLLAQHPEFQQQVMGNFYTPEIREPVQVVAFSGRKTNTPYGIWGEIARQLGKESVFADFYAPLKPPGDSEWVELLQGQPVLILLDELPPYFEAARAVTTGMTTLESLTTTALANLLVAVTSGKLPQAAVILTDLRAQAYGAGSAAMSDALKDLAQEANRSVVAIDPVRLASDELYHILRTRLFEYLPDPNDIDAIADAYAQAIDEAAKMDLTTASPQQMRAAITSSYPFHPSIRDLYARFKENSGFQQTRALIRIMRKVVARLWQESNGAKHVYMVNACDIDLHDSEIMSEIRQINNTFDAAIARDIANEQHDSFAEQIDGPDSTDAQDAAKLIFLSSLSRAINPTIGLDRSEIIKYLVAPDRSIAPLNTALDDLQRRAWYLHASSGGLLQFKNIENLNSRLEAYVQGMVVEARENELRERLRSMFDPKTEACYQEIVPLPAVDQVQLSQDRITLIILKPSSVPTEMEEFYRHQQYKNRMLFLTGDPNMYRGALERSAYVRAIQLIINELEREGRRESDPEHEDARAIRTRELSRFYLACREAFQQIYYPSQRGLTPLDFDPSYETTRYEGEEQILMALREAYKYEDKTSADDRSFRETLERKLWPQTQEAAWNDEIKRRAATDSSWLWHHPDALDVLKVELIRRDIWRDVGGGFVQRGPFPKPNTSVTVQQLSRDPQSGKAKLRVRPLHGDQVYFSQGNTVSTSSQQLESYDLETSDPIVSFLSVDSKGEHATGDPFVWENTIEVKYDYFQRGDQLICELRAIPQGDIRYTTDGSSPERSGQAYTDPFAVPQGTRVILAQATASGVTSNLLRVDVPDEPGQLGPTVDAKKPATFKRRVKRDSTSEAYQLLETLVRHNAQLGGIRVDVARDQRFVSLQTDEETYQQAEQVREHMTRLRDIISGGNLTLDIEQMQFETGQSLLDLVEALRLTLEPGDVEQKP